MQTLTAPEAGSHKSNTKLIRRLSRLWLDWLRRALPLRDAGPLAEPWRRFLAAAIDTSLLFFCLVLVRLWLLVSTPVTNGFASDQSLAQENLLDLVTPIVCWLYVLIGWTLGATLGMRILKIRIQVLKSGSRPGFVVALKRIAGFILACLPVKGGLFPILTHPLRQGWHDQIAGTVVVKGSPDKSEMPSRPAPAERPRSYGEFAEAPDLSILRRGWLWPLLTYTVLALIFTYPLVRHMGTRLAGIPGDGFQFASAYWWTSYAISHHLPLLTTTMMFYPHSTPLIYNTMDWFNCFVSLPLLPRLGLIRTYNTLFLFSLVSSAFCAYLLFAAVTRSRLAAAIVAPIYGLSPFFMLHGLGHMNIISGEFLPLFCLFTYAAFTIKQRQFLYAALAGASMGLSGLCDLQYPVLACVLLACLFAGLFWKRHDWDAARLYKRAGLVATIGVSAFVVMGWLIIPALQQRHSGSYMDTEVINVAALSDYVQPASFFKSLPDKDAAIGTTLDDSVEHTLTIGGAILILALIGLLLRFRKLYPWWALFVGALVLSFGGYLVIGWLPTTGGVFLILLGFPGNGFGPYWEMTQLVALAAAVIGNPASLVTLSCAVAMPFGWIHHLIPPLQPFRNPVRIALVVFLAVGTLAATGLGELMKRIGLRFGKTAALGLGAVSALFILLEFYPAPYATYVPLTSPYFSVLAGDKSNGPVVDIPLRYDARYLFDQAYHQKPLYTGYLSRTPKDVADFVKANPFLIYCTKYSPGLAGFTPIENIPLADLRSGLDQLRSLHTRYVIVHRAELPGDALSDVRNVLTNDLGLKEIHEDAYAIIYRIP